MFIKEYKNKNINAKDILSANIAISTYFLINKLILGYTFIEIYNETSMDKIESISFTRPLE